MKMTARFQNADPKRHSLGKVKVVIHKIGALFLPLSGYKFPIKIYKDPVVPPD